MEQLLPLLSGEQFSSLECDIWENGCYASINVNEDMVIVDGHNRFRICEKHGLPYTIMVFLFADLLVPRNEGCLANYLDATEGRWYHVGCHPVPYAASGRS